jgi:hypothetical protein
MKRLFPNGAERHPGTHVGPRIGDSSVINSNDLYTCRRPATPSCTTQTAAPLPVVKPDFYSSVVNGKEITVRRLPQVPEENGSATIGERGASWQGHFL